MTTKFCRQTSNSEEQFLKGKRNFENFNGFEKQTSHKCFFLGNLNVNSSRNKFEP